MGVPTEARQAEAMRRLLVEIARGVDANDVVVDLGDLHVRRNTFPGEVFIALAADALELAGVDRTRPIDEQTILSRYLSEIELRGREQRRFRYALHSAFAVHGGLEPDLLDEVFDWVDVYWQYALFAAVAVVRACADGSGVSVEAFCADLAARHRVELI